MKRIVTALLICFLCAACRTAAADVVDKIAIIVNNEIITMGEIDRMLAPVYARYRTVYTDQRDLAKKMQEARKRVIDQLIEDKLIVSEAKRRNVQIDDKEIAAKLKETMGQFATQKEFTKALLEQHLTLRELKNKYREQMMSRRLIDGKIGSRIMVGPVEVHTYYNGHIEDFVQPGRVTMRDILIRPKGPDDVARAESLARELDRRLDAGERFTDLAKTYSDGPGAAEGGLVKTVKQGDLLPEIEKVVFSLKAGEVSGVVKSPLGFHLFMVEEVVPQRTLGVKEAYKEIEELIFREKIRREMKDWLAELRKNAYIAFK